MQSFRNMIHGGEHMGGETRQIIRVNAAGLATDQYGNTVSTTTTSGIVKMKVPGIVEIGGELGAGLTIIFLPAANTCPCGICIVEAFLDVTYDGDVSVYLEETGGEYSTSGDLDTTLDVAAFVSTGAEWLMIGSSIS
jgi:hypothetical protein